MTSPRLPLVKAQRSFLQRTPWIQSESNSATYKKTEVWNSLGFTIRYLVFSLVVVFLSIRIAGINRRNNKLKKMDIIQEKALKMALSFIVHFVCTSQKFSLFTSNRPACLMMFESQRYFPYLKAKTLRVPKFRVFFYRWRCSEIQHGCQGP